LIHFSLWWMTFRKFLHCYDISSKVLETFQVLMKSNFYTIFSLSGKQAVPPPGHVLDRDGTSTRFYFTCLMLVSPRQTSIYVMCPWDHDILIIELSIAPLNHPDDSECKGVQVYFIYTEPTPYISSLPIGLANSPLVHNKSSQEVEYTCRTCRKCKSIICTSHNQVTLHRRTILERRV
jgi:hypothetical protein